MLRKLLFCTKAWCVWLALAQSCVSGWDSSFLTSSHNSWQHREEYQQPSKHLDQTSHTATSCVLCRRGLGNASPAAKQKKKGNLCSMDPSHSVFTAKAGYYMRPSNPKCNHVHSKMFSDISCTLCLLRSYRKTGRLIFQRGCWIAPIQQSERCETEEKGLVVEKYSSSTYRENQLMIMDTQNISKKKSNVSEPFEIINALQQFQQENKKRKMAWYNLLK